MNRTQTAALTLFNSATDRRVARPPSPMSYASQPDIPIAWRRPVLSSARYRGDPDAKSYVQQALAAQQLQAQSGKGRAGQLSTDAQLAALRKRPNARSGNNPAFSAAPARARAPDAVMARETSRSGLTFDPKRLLRTPIARTSRNGAQLPRVRPSSDQGLRTRLDPTTLQIEGSSQEEASASAGVSLAGGRVARILGKQSAVCARSEYDS